MRQLGEVAGGVAPELGCPEVRGAGTPGGIGMGVGAIHGGNGQRETAWTKSCTT